MAAISRRDRTTCRLLFVGVEWERKGADTAIAVAAAMRQAGVETTLTMIGCLPPTGVRVPDFVNVVGFVSKRTPEGNRLIEQHFRESHFFVLPTRAEAYGMVFCEASAFGLPSLAPRVGGIPSIIEDGVNGWLLPTDAAPEEYARPMLREVARSRGLRGDGARQLRRVSRSAELGRRRRARRGAHARVRARAEIAGRRDAPRDGQRPAPRALHPHFFRDLDRLPRHRDRLSARPRPDRAAASRQRSVRPLGHAQQPEFRAGLQRLRHRPRRAKPGGGSARPGRCETRALGLRHRR